MKTYTYTFTVPASAIDFNGHVNNVTYLEWMMEAATRHAQAAGMGYEQCLEHGGTWVARFHRIEYRNPAFEGEELRMITWIESIGRIVSRRRYALRRIADDALVSEGETEWVFVDAKRMRPMRIPAVVSAVFSE